ncbi:MAG: hypothetical protein ACHQWU_03360 [Gemmatimonadales bacterium]
MRKVSLICLLSVGAGLAACSGDSTSAPSNGLVVDMTAFAAAPAGFDQLSTSFNGSPTASSFLPTFDRGDQGENQRHSFGPLGKGPGFGIGLMGGGLGKSFLGEGIGFFLAHDSDNCAFDSATGIKTCTVTKRNGLTITRTLEFAAAGGAPQPQVDATTDAVTTTTAVTGTVTRRDSSTSTIDAASTATVSGLSSASTVRTVNGKAQGTETTNGGSFMGIAFSATRTAGDTITDLTFNKTGGPNFPTGGTVVRSMTVNVTLQGSTPATSTRREVVTYDGSSTAKVVITHDAATQNCTLPLPFGRLTCQ